MNVKEKINVILKGTNKNGINDLLEWMDKNGFYDAPCSSKYHLAQPGGLAEHSLNVLRVASSMLEAFYIKQGKPLSAKMLDSVVICSLLHDLGKTGQYGKPNYRLVPKMHDGEAFGRFEFETNKDLLYIPHEVRSIAIASQFIELTEEEQFAILYHNGLYGELQSIKGKETELYMILHFADMWASRVVEKEG